MAKPGSGGGDCTCQTEISDLQSQIDSLVTAISSLESSVAGLQVQVNQFRTTINCLVDVHGGPSGSGCSYV